MALGIQHSIEILAPGSSLRRRVAYSLAIVRLILAPVIFLAIYYLFEMGWIVDRIVSTDTPAATMAEDASIEMLEARRAERNYLLLRDAPSLEVNHASVRKVRETLGRIQTLEPEEQRVTGKALDALRLYEMRFAATVGSLETSDQSSTDRIQRVVRAYEKDLNELLMRARFKKRTQLIDELRSRVDSFDAQISKTVQEGDPALRQVSRDLQRSSQEILQLTSELEASSLKRIQDDHLQARHLIRRAEWALGSVSALTILLSIWISFILPHQVVKPLLNLKAAVDRAAAGDYEIDFDIQGKGEVVQLANSVRNLVDRLRRKS
jgi:methyl-accepting chemotaxis protein